MIRCFCLITCLLLTKVAGQVKLSIDLCRTNIKQEDCSRTMRIDEMGTYPFTQREERLYFKISADEHNANSEALYWPYNCYLLGVNEAASVNNIIVEKGCPKRGQMSISMDNTNPIKVGFVLSRIVGTKDIQESMHIKCEVAECTTLNNCPRSRCGVNERAGARKEWTEPLITAISKGYLFLENFRVVTPPVLPVEIEDEAQAEQCRTKMKELRNECGMLVNELLILPEEMKK